MDVFLGPYPVNGIELGDPPLSVVSEKFDLLLR